MKKISLAAALLVLFTVAFWAWPGFAFGNASVSPPGEDLVPIAFGVMSVAVPTDQVQAAIGQLNSEGSQYSLYLAGFLGLLHPCASIAGTTIVPVLAINQVAIRWSMTPPEDLDPGDAQIRHEALAAMRDASSCVPAFPPPAADR
jgi:hypothetical protein